MPADRSSVPAAGRVDIAIGAALLGLCAAVITVFAFAQSTTRASKATVIYNQTGSFSYSATVSPSSLYGSRSITTGAPIYTTLVHRLTVGYAYGFQSAKAAKLAGTEQLVAAVQNTQGLTRTVPLESPRPFAGTSFRATATLDTATLNAIAEAFDQVAGSSTGTYVLTISPTVQAYGSIGTTSFRTTFGQPLTFNFDGQTLLPTASGGGGLGGASASPFSSSATGTVSIPARDTATLLPHLTVSSARLAGLALFLLALLVGTVHGRRVFRDMNAGDQDRRLAVKYGSLIVDARALPRAPDVVVVELGAVADLVRLARKFQTSLLRERQRHGTTIYAVLDDGVMYRYVSGRLELEDAGAEPPRAARIEGDDRQWLLTTGAGASSFRTNGH